MNKQTSANPTPSYDALVNENNELRRELQRVTVNRNFIGSLFVDAARHLQLSSTSIKVAVSSLLSYDIFWDPANQHEFLETINTSTNKINNLIVLLTLAFRAEAGTLALNPEPQALQEILAAVQRKAAIYFPNLRLDLVMPENGKGVIVDYEYLVLAFIYLFGPVGEKTDVDALEIRAQENDDHWSLDIFGLANHTLETIEKINQSKTHLGEIDTTNFSPEKFLGLHIACKILDIQNIKIKDRKQNTDRFLYMVIPSSPNGK